MRGVFEAKVKRKHFDRKISAPVKFLPGILAICTGLNVSLCRKVEIGREQPA